MFWNLLKNSNHPKNVNHALDYLKRDWLAMLNLQVKSAEFQSPYLIPSPPIPEQNPLKSTMPDDLCQMAADPQFANVEFHCQDGFSVFAHRTLLAAGE